MSTSALVDPGIAPLWAAVRERLERSGLDNRGRLAVPELDVDARLTLKSLLGRPRAPRRLDLAELETALLRLGIGSDLASAMAVLGHAVSEEPARLRAERARARAAREAARQAAARWSEPWAPEWIDTVIRSGALSGLDSDEAIGIVADTKRVLDRLDSMGSVHDLFDASAVVSRVELASKLLGDAHALDDGRTHKASVIRALAFRHDLVGADDALVWGAAGVHPDLTSGPVLTWALPVIGGLAPLVRAATLAGVPLHLSRFALTDHPILVEAGTEVLVVENPRIVEAAAQMRVSRAVVSADGSPSGAVQLLIRQLLDARAVVRYHGDFDAAGLALCARMWGAGVIPWRMGAGNYRAALADADSQAVRLPLETNPCPETPWDPGLRKLFTAERRIVHEERLLPGLLEDGGESRG